MRQHPRICTKPEAMPPACGGFMRDGRNTADPFRPRLKRETPPICHCEAPTGPWQSREGTADSYRPPLKSHAPIASVAALPERHAGWAVCAVLLLWRNAPRLSFRGAKRRGNLLQAAAILPIAFPQFSWVLRDCHVGLWPPRNDKSESFSLFTFCSQPSTLHRPCHIILCSFFSACSNSSGRGQESVISSPVRGCRNVSSFAWRHWECRPSSGLPMP